MAVYFASGIRLEPEELGAALALQSLISGHHALCHAVAQREQHRRDQLWLGFHHVSEPFGRHEQQIARGQRQDIGGPQGSSLEPGPVRPPSSPLGRRGVASVGFLRLRVLREIELERRRFGLEDVRPGVNLEPHVDQAASWHVIDVLAGEVVRQLGDAGVVPDAGDVRGLGRKGPDDASPLSGLRQVQPVIEHDPLLSVTDLAGDKCGGVAGTLGLAGEEQIWQPVALGQSRAHLGRVAEAALVERSTVVFAVGILPTRLRVTDDGKPLGQGQGGLLEFRDDGFSL